MHKGHHQENMCGQYIDTQVDVLPIPRNPKTELRPQNNIENNVKKLERTYASNLRQHTVFP